jgi:hypothetical protein
MRKSGVNLAVLRLLARSILYPNSSSSTVTISSSSSPEPLRNVGYPHHSRQPDSSFRMSSSKPPPDVHVFPQNYERGPAPYYPHARNPPRKVQSSKSQRRHIVTVSPSESGPSPYYPYGPPARARSPSRFSRIVDLRERENVILPTDAEHGHPLGRLDDDLAFKHTKSQHQKSENRKAMPQPSIYVTGNEPAQDDILRGRRSISASRGRNLHTTSDYGVVTNERPSLSPQRAGHNLAPTHAIIEPRPSNHSSSRRRNRGSDIKQAEYQSPARESASTSHRNPSCVDEPSAYRRPQVSNNIHPQSSSSNDPRQTERRKRTSRSKSVGTEDEQHMRRKRTPRSRSSSLNHQDHQQMERGKGSSRSRRSSSISQGDEQPTERRRRTSNSTSSYDSGIYVAASSSDYTASDRPLTRVPNVNLATRPPASTSHRTSRRTSSASSYDSGVFMSSTASYTSRRGSADRNFVHEPSPLRRPNVLHSYPPPSYYFDKDQPRGRRRSSRDRLSSTAQSFSVYV